MPKVYAPGCALMIYKPELAQKVLAFLNQAFEVRDEHLICCRHEPKIEKGTQVINTCPGCDKRYRTLYQGVSTVSLWEILAESKSFPFPDYQGKAMAILDACPTRDQVRVHQAVRTLMKRMNIDLKEPKRTGAKSICCGDSYFGTLSVDRVKEQMQKRARQMPVNDVVVYCVSCCKSMYIGGKQPRYMVDLLFGEPTLPKTFEPEAWHKELDEFIDVH
jgi:Fe-S oxidoreductase